MMLYGWCWMLGWMWIAWIRWEFEVDAVRVTVDLGVCEWGRRMWSGCCWSWERMLG